jgi:hypothetical protein
MDAAHRRVAIFARLCKFISGCRGKMSTGKSASVYECVRFTWPKNRLLGQVASPFR